MLKIKIKLARIEPTYEVACLEDRYNGPYWTVIQYEGDEPTNIYGAFGSEVDAEEKRNELIDMDRDDGIRSYDEFQKRKAEEKR
jgi:hypothetical protein